MKMLDIPRISSNDNTAETGYYIKESSGKHLEEIMCGWMLTSHSRPHVLPWSRGDYYLQAWIWKTGEILAIQVGNARHCKCWE